MEPVIVISQHGNQSYSRKKQQFSPSPSRGLKGIDCRTFELSTNPNAFPFSTSSQTPKKQSSSIPIVPKLPPKPTTPVSDINAFPFSTSSQTPKKQSSSIPIITKFPPKSATPVSDINDLSDPELWAGPAYSNSPPPSSLPIPKFSLCQKRCPSLELPAFSPEYKLPSFAKSAPSSPTRDPCSPANDFSLTAASATENLRRILNLDVADD